MKFGICWLQKISLLRMVDMIKPEFSNDFVKLVGIKVMSSNAVCKIKTQKIWSKRVVMLSNEGGID
jgi:hypothetical protein